MLSSVVSLDEESIALSRVSSEERETSGATESSPLSTVTVLHDDEPQFCVAESMLRRVAAATRRRTVRADGPCAMYTLETNILLSYYARFKGNYKQTIEYCYVGVRDKVTRHLISKYISSLFPANHSTDVLTEADLQCFSCRHKILLVQCSCSERATQPDVFMTSMLCLATILLP